MYHADTNPEATHTGWEAQKGIKSQNPLKQVMSAFGVTLKELRSGNRKQHLVDARSMVAAALMQQQFTRQQDIAELLGISQAAVSHLLVRHRNLVEVDPKYQRQWERISNLTSQVSSLKSQVLSLKS